MTERNVHSWLVEFGRDALSFPALETDKLHWYDEPSPGGTGACVAYVETRWAWVGAAGPLALAEHQSQAAARFTAAARATGRRASFFATESFSSEHFSRLLIGQQPIFRPRQWLSELQANRRLREQLRRVRAKGICVRRVLASELESNSQLRTQIEKLAQNWLRSRHMEPMGFLATLEPFVLPEEHRYFIAERGSQPIAFLSAVPIYRQQAWLVEDIVRTLDAPNGTTESLFVALLEAVPDATFVTLGLTPLSGPIAWPLRLAKWASRPLYDFEGLEKFRARLHPHEWQPIWLAYPRGGFAATALFDALTAFAHGKLVRFGIRSIVRHPSGPPWLLALPLIPWTLGLTLLALFARPSLLGFDVYARWGWLIFDALLAAILYRAAVRPRLLNLLFAALLAGGDATLSVLHIASVGFGSTFGEHVIRGLAVLAPCAGTAVLAWATFRAHAHQRDLQHLPTHPKTSISEVGTHIANRNARTENKSK